MDRPIASARHTAILSAILLGIALIGWLALNRGAGGGASAGPATYLGLAAGELALVYYVWVGIRRQGVGLAELISTRPLDLRTLVRDVAVGALLLLVLLALEWALAQVLGGGDRRMVRALVAGATTYPPLWIALSALAGFAEEVTYRGYLQRQFAAWSRRPWVGVVVQAALFGVTHGYQGPVLILKIALLGLVLGTVAWLRRSIVPGIVAHIALDVIGGLVGPA